MLTSINKRKWLIRLSLLLLLFALRSAAAPRLTVRAAAKLSSTTRKVKYGRSFTLKVKGTKKKVKWSSSNRKIATVTSSGRYTARIKAKQKYGTAVITARVGKVRLSCRVYVSKTGKVSKAYSTVIEADQHPVSGGTWKSTRYRDKNGWYLTSTFARIGKYRYYFGSDSKKKKGFFDVDGYSYWADSTGHLAVSATPMMSDGDCYAFDANGHMVKGREIRIGDNYYYYDYNGVQVHQAMVGTRYYGPKASRLFDLETAFSGEMSARDLSSYEYLYVGASKPYQMGVKLRDLDSRICFNCASGATIGFFFSPHRGTEALLPVIRKYLTQRPNGIVISEMSGNDLENLNGYIGIYKAIREHFPRARLALLDMLPVRKGAAKNATCMWFNNALHSTFGPWNPVTGGCLYGFEHLYNQPDFRTVDGTHYPDDMKRVTYEYIMKTLGRPVKIEYTTVSDTTENWTAVTECLPDTVQSVAR